MKTTDKTKKQVKPTLFVNLLNVDSPLEVKAAFVMSKVSAGIPITDTELKQFAECVVDITMKLTEEIYKLSFPKCTIVIERKNKNFFAKAWNWFKNLFKKKK